MSTTDVKIIPYPYESEKDAQGLGVKIPPAITSLTPTQYAVLLELTQGKSNEEISQALEISVKTTKAHLTKIYKTLGCSTARKLLVWYYTRPDFYRPPCTCGSGCTCGVRLTP